MSHTQTYFAISRRLHAPRERVFQAWTDPLEVSRWLGSAPFVYQEVDAPARLVFTIDDDALAIVTLAVAGDHTVMTFEGAAAPEDAETVERCWAAVLDRLADHVSQAGGNAGGILPG